MLPEQDPLQLAGRHFSHLKRSMYELPGQQIASCHRLARRSDFFHISTHVGDVIRISPEDSLPWVRSYLCKQCKAEMFGGESQHLQVVQFLSRAITWTEGGLDIEAYQKHVSRLIHEWGTHQCKGSDTPCNSSSSTDREVLLSESEGCIFRRSAAIVDDTPPDRVDLSFVSKPQGMSTTRSEGLRRLKKLFRSMCNLWALGSRQACRFLHSRLAPRSVCACVCTCARNLQGTDIECASRGDSTHASSVFQPAFWRGGCITSLNAGRLFPR